MERKRKVAYLYNQEIGKFTYGKMHFMDPKRISMTHSLIIGYGLYRELDVYNSREASKDELISFHSKDYIDYLENYISQSKVDLLKQLNLPYPEIKLEIKNDEKLKERFGIDVQADCPGFDGLYTFSQLSVGGSIDAATLIINNQADIAINWGGGLHHAKKQEAYGFCYINDIVICILELLKVFSRVLYVDIDVHHGDGVEQAFFTTNRVMTVSFHEFGDGFFPGTGGLNSIGEGEGKHHSINVPLAPGIDDDSYRQVFELVIQKVFETFRPDVVVMQMGADSIAQDKIGHFNMSIMGHSNCLKHIMKYGVPIIMLGGGGYTVPNVARCWTYETGIALGKDLQEKIPEDDEFYHQYQQTNLHIPINNGMQNKNTKEDLDYIMQKIFEYLKEIEPAPGFQFHNVPDTFNYDSDDEEYKENEYGEKMIDETEYKRKKPVIHHKAYNINY